MSFREGQKVKIDNEDAEVTKVAGDKITVTLVRKTQTDATMPGEGESNSGTPPMGDEEMGGRRRGKKTRKTTKRRRSTRRKH